MNIKQFLHTKKGKKNTRGGFTLIEILISITIFAIVMVVAVGALVTIIDANRKSHSTQLAVNNVNAAVDHMSWEIRNGSDYYCIDEDGDPITDPNNCDAGDDIQAFGFKASDGSDRQYKLVNGRIQRIINDGDTLQTADLTSHAEEVTISKLNFSLMGNGEDAQPAVTITVEGIAGVNEKTDSHFNIQTTVSERFNVVYGEGESNTSNFEACPFVEQPSRTIVDFYEIKGAHSTVRGDHGSVCREIEDSVCRAGHSTVSSLVPILGSDIQIPAGNYRISLAVFDEDNERSEVPGYEEFDEQPGEIAYMGFLNTGGVPLSSFNQRSYGDHVEYIFGHTSNSQDIPFNEDIGECEYDSDSNPNCGRSWYGVIDEEFNVVEDIQYIKIFHGRPAWQSFMYSFFPTDFENDESWGRERAEEIYGHDPDRLVDGGAGGDMIASCYEPGSSSNDGCANSFVVLCAAFDNLDATGELDIEDF